MPAFHVAQGAAAPGLGVGRHGDRPGLEDQPAVAPGLAGGVDGRPSEALHPDLHGERGGAVVERLAVVDLVTGDHEPVLEQPLLLGLVVQQAVDGLLDVLQHLQVVDVPEGVHVAPAGPAQVGVQRSAVRSVFGPEAEGAAQVAVGVRGAAQRGVVALFVDLARGVEDGEAEDLLRPAAESFEFSEALGGGEPCEGCARFLHLIDPATVVSHRSSSLFGLDSCRASSAEGKDRRIRRRRRSFR
ncbi:hypothetical protein KCH_60740 [Kitasatospora cheerisanensis KCTC 2395]|uniref:Uncharacterized protein n=1 Tax=Kitasatospora cheerisanensis KCTC 2395 TaxID=1348663 RepID=A0A066YVU6_9ACTN|nr:hypothetical protein KCH_60740 [Kitasatospora cheerisanensis KCTC 2395]